MKEIGSLRGKRKVDGGRLRKQTRPKVKEDRLCPIRLQHENREGIDLEMGRCFDDYRNEFVYFNREKGMIH
jgi:hypothetical protein